MPTGPPTAARGLAVGSRAAGTSVGGARFTCALRTLNHHVTPSVDSQSMRRLAVLLSALFLACAGTALAGSVSKVPPIPRVPGLWSHVEINRKIGKTPHTLILDRGRVTQARGDPDHDPRARKPGHRPALGSDARRHRRAARDPQRPAAEDDRRDDADRRRRSRARPRLVLLIALCEQWPEPFSSSRTSPRSESSSAAT